MNMTKFGLEPEGLEREMMVKEMENGFLIDSHIVCTLSLTCDFFNFYAVYGIYFVYNVYDVCCVYGVYCVYCVRRVIYRPDSKKG